MAMFLLLVVLTVILILKQKKTQPYCLQCMLKLLPERLQECAGCGGLGVNVPQPVHDRHDIGVETDSFITGQGRGSVCQPTESQQTGE